MTELEKKESIKSSKSDWFEQLIASIRVDQLQVETKVASKSKVDFYDTMMEGNSLKMAQLGRETSTQIFILSLVKDYFNEFKERAIDPLHLALELNDASILVWAEVKENDEETEKSLILAEAKVNAKYSQYGFYISSTIVEDADRISIPSHYEIVK